MPFTKVLKAYWENIPNVLMIPVFKIAYNCCPPCLDLLFPGDRSVYLGNIGPDGYKDFFTSMELPKEMLR